MPHILKHQPTMPEGYTLVRWHEADGSSQLLVIRANGKYVAGRKAYKNQRSAVLAARRSAFMIMYNRVTNAAA